MIRLLPLILLAMTLSCGFLKEKSETVKHYFFHEEPVLDPCDPINNLYTEDSHYIGADFLDEDGRIDTLKWYNAKKIENSDCDPVKRGKKKRSD